MNQTPQTQPARPRIPPAPKMGPKAKGASLVGILAMTIAVTLGLEGGYVNDPVDPGGETNHGVTIAVARESGFRGRMVDLKRECDYSIRLPASIAATLSPEEVKDIESDDDGTEPCAAQIYYKDYIEKPGFVPLFLIDPWVAREVFDTAINMGPARPSRYFQRAVNDSCGTTLTADGKIGPITVKAWSDCRIKVGPKVCVSMIDNLDAQQRAEYLRLIRRNPSLQRFRNGWLNHRIGNVKTSNCGKEMV